jgi:hypothetical protein
MFDKMTWIYLKTSLSLFKKLSYTFVNNNIINISYMWTYGLQQNSNNETWHNNKDDNIHFIHLIIPLMYILFTIQRLIMSQTMKYTQNAHERVTRIICSVVTWYWKNSRNAHLITIINTLPFRNGWCTLSQITL